MHAKHGLPLITLPERFLPLPMHLRKMAKFLILEYLTFFGVLHPSGTPLGEFHRRRATTFLTQGACVRKVVPFWVSPARVK
jgi:hypothetical protein